MRDIPRITFNWKNYEKNPPPIWFLEPGSFKRLSFFIFLLICFVFSNSCQKEELLPLPEQGDEGFFLYEKQDNRMKNYAINFLTKQNDSARFVPDFRKEYGMPLWDNEIIFEYENSKVLLFPVLLGKNARVHALLYFVFGKDGLSFNTILREKMYPDFGDTEALFLWVDHNVFGETSVEGIRIESPKGDPFLKEFFEYRRCWVVMVSGDGGNTWTQTDYFCSSSFYWSGDYGDYGGENPYEEDYGDWGDPGGGNGGSTNPPPADPLPVNPILTVKDPCELVSLHAEDEALRNLLKDLKKDARRNKFEEGYILTTNSNFSSNGGLFNTEYVTSNANDYIDVQLDPGQTINGFIHTHHKDLVPMFTADDIAKIYEWYQSGHIQNLNNFTMILINGKDGSSYNISIHDPTLFISFCQTKLNTSQKIDFWTSQINGWQIVGQEGLIRAFLDVFNNAGISLFQGNISASQWNRKELNQNGYVVNNNCPN